MAIKKQSAKWLNFLEDSYQRLVDSKPIRFNAITPSQIPKVGGVYLITAKKSSKESAYYIGRSKNLRQRIYNNHLMGPVTNARLKRYLITAKVCQNVKDAKDFIKTYCLVRWIEEDDVRRRGAIEGYDTSVVFPMYGIYEEH